MTTTPVRGARSGLQIAIHEVDLLQAAKALATGLRPHVSPSLDGLQLWVAGRQDLVQAAELSDDRLDHKFRQPRNASEDAVPPWRDGMVERVQLSVVAQQLRQAPEVEEVLVRQAGQRVEHE